MFGGAIRILCTASAPLSAEVKKYFCQALGVEMMEAYGMTECSGAETITSLKDDTRYTHIGGVCVNFDMKLKDLPDMNYLSTDVDE